MLINRKIILYLSLILLNFGVIAFSVKTNTVRGVGLEEARYIPAGVYHWRHGGFAFAADTPPLARMIAALPMLALGVDLPPDDQGVRGVDSADERDRELRYAGRFASSAVNLHWYRLFCLARVTGFLWWLLGAWVICRWSGELYGGPAGGLALALWCICPNVIAFEQQVTPELPLAVAWASAIYASRGYLRTPSGGRALAWGLLLGVALLVDFATLALLVTWPLMALSLRPGRPPGASAGVGPRARMWHVILAVLSCIWVVNLGYGFGGTGAPLGSIDLAGHDRDGSTSPHGEPAAAWAGGNRIQGTWLGRVACPVPADYLAGLDRRLGERGGASPPRGEAGWPVGAGDTPLARAGERRPIGLWGLMLGSLILLVTRHVRVAPMSEELALWLPVGAAVVLATPAVGLLSTAAGVLLATPFGIVMASKIACLQIPGRRWAAWIAALLALGAIASSLNTIAVDQFTPENRARFRLDLGKHLRRLGFPTLEEEIVVGGGRRRGLRYDTFVDSRGVAMNYALYVPRGYRGDRPYPLILFLHGYGDRGTSGFQFTAKGLPFTLGYREIDFLVLCPQSRSGSWRLDGDDGRGAMELLAAVEREYEVDPGRIALMGLSSGGTGVWEFAARYPGRWAAIVPVASAPRDPGQAPLIKDIPCWCFHNHYDGGSPAAEVRRMIKALRAAGGDPKYTEYLDINHNAGDRAFILPGLFDWLARQRLP